MGAVSILKRLAVIVVVLACATVGVSAEELRGKVVGVTDGDTIVVLDLNHQQHRIRLNGIDAPEAGQAYGQVAKRSLSNLVFGQDVTVVWNKVDRYGRLVGTVMVGATDANLEQIRGGFAWFYREYANELTPKNRTLYEAAQSDAKSAKRGLWTDSAPVPPWDFRSPSRAASQPRVEAGTTTSEVRGNIRSRIYHVAGCQDYDRIALQNRVIFKTEVEASAAGYRKAKNCK